MTIADPPMDFLAGQLADAEAGWSVGTFGAIAEFTREAGEPFEMERSRERISVATEKGGIRIVSHPDLRMIASESPTTESWGPSRRSLPSARAERHERPSRPVGDRSRSRGAAQPGSQRHPV